ncbi:hypothetical protein O9G_000326 [Rozella allomycis CSF55]|uniref:F-box domain-containing protein n=1 Tax=Rozella allomycis (strain CSF55) TaxID=988480 RepID=A0A075ATH9_ROZAC|nr:hypothetical protein O9G_000326 [Rozella allomycis CSF55]|eukprot:EPZ31847.1 hypothetical protein O9G_000326 [Rozella allomycis CSF55]
MAKLCEANNGKTFSTAEMMKAKKGYDDQNREIEAYERMREENYNGKNSTDLIEKIGQIQECAPSSFDIPKFQTQEETLKAARLSKATMNGEHWKEYYESGKKFFQLQDYENALQEFTKAIQLKKNHILYDCRAEVFERLKDYEAAKADALNTIKYNSSIARGYIRLTRLNIKSKKYNEAVKYATLGLKAELLNENDKYHLLKLLDVLNEKLVTNQIKKNTYDILQYFPKEVIDEILKYLPQHSFQWLAMMNKSWNDFCSREGFIYQQVIVKSKKHDWPKRIAKMFKRWPTKESNIIGIARCQP